MEGCGRAKKIIKAGPLLRETLARSMHRFAVYGKYEGHCQCTPGCSNWPAAFPELSRQIACHFATSFPNSRHQAIEEGNHEAGVYRDELTDTILADLDRIRHVDMAPPRLFRSKNGAGKAPPPSHNGRGARSQSNFAALLQKRKSEDLPWPSSGHLFDSGNLDQIIVGPQLEQPMCTADGNVQQVS
jgi:hypothetical protein